MLRSVHPYQKSYKFPGLAKPLHPIMYVQFTQCRNGVAVLKTLQTHTEESLFEIIFSTDYVPMNEMLSNKNKNKK